MIAMMVIKEPHLRRLSISRIGSPLRSRMVRCWLHDLRSWLGSWWRRLNTLSRCLRRLASRASWRIGWCLWTLWHRLISKSRVDETTGDSTSRSIKHPASKLMIWLSDAMVRPIGMFVLFPIGPLESMDKLTHVETTLRHRTRLNKICGRTGKSISACSGGPVAGNRTLSLPLGTPVRRRM